MEKLPNDILQLTRQAEKLKFEKTNPAIGGRRYSPSYIDFVNETKRQLSQMQGFELFNTLVFIDIIRNYDLKI